MSSDVASAQLSPLNQTNDPYTIATWFSFPQSQWFLSKSLSNNFINGIDKWFFDKNKFVTQNFINTHFDFVNEKFKTQFAPEVNKISLSFTKDPQLLEQYYGLRERSYRSDLGFEKYNGCESDFDKRGDIMVATQNSKVVAGARIDLSNRSNLMCNDNPQNGFFYKDVIKKFDQTFSESDTYSEICALVISEGMKNKFLLARLVTLLIRFSKESGCKYSVGIAYPNLCDFYRVMFKSYGDNFKIFNDISCPYDHKKYGSNRYDLVFHPMVLKF